MKRRKKYDIYLAYNKPIKRVYFIIMQVGQNLMVLAGIMLYAMPKAKRLLHMVQFTYPCIHYTNSYTVSLWTLSFTVSVPRYSCSPVTTLTNPTMPSGDFSSCQRTASRAWAPLASPSTIYVCTCPALHLAAANHIQILHSYIHHFSTSSIFLQVFVVVINVG